MSSKEWIAKQQRKVDELLKIFPEAVQTSHTQTMERIYESGLLGDQGDQKFQYNDTTPLYLNPKTSEGSFEPAGKPKSTGGRFDKGLGLKAKRRSRKPIKKGLDSFTRKTRWFKSYKQYRREIGSEINYVNLRLGGTQFRDNATSLTIFSINRVAVGFKNKANSEKFRGQREKYGDYHKPTKGERELLVKTIQDQRRRLAV